MAIDASKTPSAQSKSPTGPALERPDHEDDKDLELDEADFEDFGGNN